MLNFKPSKLALAILSTGLIAMSTSSFAYAEETKAEDKKKQEILDKGDDPLRNKIEAERIAQSDRETGFNRKLANEFLAKQNTTIPDSVQSSVNNNITNQNNKGNIAYSPQTTINLGGNGENTESLEKTIEDINQKQLQQIEYIITSPQE